MKKVACVIMMLLCGVAFMNCSAKKHTIKQSDIERQIDSLRMAYKLDSLKMELEKAKEKLTPNMGEEPDDTRIAIPCAEYQTDDEYYYAFGIRENEHSMGSAVQRAIMNAQIELQKQVGGDVEMGAVEQVCREVSCDIYGNWSAYVSIRYPKNKQ